MSSWYRLFFHCQVYVHVHFQILFRFHFYKDQLGSGNIYLIFFNWGQNEVGWCR